MAEEALVFYPVITPIFLAAGFDLLVPLAVIFGGTQLGYLSSFTNPFSTIIASNAAGINWIDGFSERIAIFIISTSGFIFYLLRYAKKVKRNPATSLVYLTDGNMPAPPIAGSANEDTVQKPGLRTTVLLILFVSTFIVLIAGVVTRDWWFLEMSTLILAATILIGFIARMSEKTFINKFIGEQKTF